MSYCIIKSFLDFAAKLWKPKILRCLYRWKVSAPLLFVILQYSPILIWMNAVEIKQSKRQKKKPQNSLFTFSTLSVTSPPFYDYLSLSLSLSLSKRIKPEHQTIRGHQNKKEQRIWVFCLRFYHFWQEWSDWVPSKRRWSFKDKDSNLTSTLHTRIFLASPVLWE